MSAGEYKLDDADRRILRVLQQDGLTVHVGGNIGEAVLGLSAPRAGAIYVLELSSYQLDLTSSLRCHVAGLRRCRGCTTGSACRAWPPMS